jgi:arylsulfatase A-like enzyme
MRRVVASGAIGLALRLSPARVGAAEQPPSAPEPNVVLLLADDLGWGDVGFNGNTAIRTPSLDQLAGSGIRFSRFYVAAPACSPSRGSLLTGRHPERYGVEGANRGHLPAEETTLADALHARGYLTGHFGKWHLGTLTTTLDEGNRGGARGSHNYSPP